MLKAYDDGRLFGATTGTGTPWILALHGWQRTHRDFARVLDGLDAVALDLPGFGASPPPPEPWGAAEYAEALLPVLDAFAAPPVVLGHSFGGRVAVHLAAAHPDRVHALVLTGVPLLRPAGASSAKVAWQFKLGRLLHARRLLSDERMEGLRRRYGSSDYANAVGVMRGVHVKAVNETYEDQLRAIKQPVELVWGDDDTAAPPSVAVEAETLLVDAHLTRLPGVAHLTPMAAPDALRDALLRQRPLGPERGEPQP
jgi:pimeloyl-ACP methyl ester carboxylesterase